MIIHKHLYLLTHFKLVLAFNLKLELWSKLRTATMMATVYSKLVTSLRKSRKFQRRNNWGDRHFQMKFLLQTLLNGSTKSHSLFYNWFVQYTNNKHEDSSIYGYVCIWVFTVSKKHSAFLFRVQQSKKSSSVTKHVDLEGLSSKYPAILNISRTSHMVSM